MEKYLVFDDGTSRKFWHIRVKDNHTVVTFGRIGTAGQTQDKAFATPEAAEKDAEKQAASKIKKGYAESQPPAQDDAAEAKTVAKASTPKSPAVPKTAAGEADVADDGQDKPWHDDEFWDGFGYYPDPADVFDYLEESRDEPKYDDEDDFEGRPAKQAAAADVFDEDIEFDEDDDEDDRERKREKARIGKMTPEQLVAYERNFIIENHRSHKIELTDSEVDENLHKRICSFIRKKAAWSRSYLECEKHIQALRILFPDEAKYKAQIKETLEHAMYEVLDDDLDERDIKHLQWLLEHGAVPGKSKHAVNRDFIAAWKKNPDPACVPAMVAECCSKAIAKLAPQYADGILEMVQQIADGTIELESGQVPRFELTPYSIYPCCLGKHGDNIYKFKFEQDEGVAYDKTLDALEESLPPLLTAMAERGDFDCVAEKLPVLAIGKHWSGLYLHHVFNKEAVSAQAEALESIIKNLEEDDDFAAHNTALREGVSALIDNVFMPVDETRALAIIKRHLYCLDLDAVETVDNMCWMYETYGFFDKIRYEYSIWNAKNGNPKWGGDKLQELAEKGHPDAAARLEEIKVDNARRAAMRAKYKSGGASVAKQSKAGKDNFHQVFAEEDLLLNTDRVLARAYVNGKIYIRFKIEGEQSYAEVLDWLNNLLEKNYADINDGYSIAVRFLIKPMFIKQLASLTGEEEEGFAKNSCHAFFARAVTWPALREKVKRYAELALRLYDWYIDLDGEENCVTGTFAACALAFAEEKYVPMIGLFARNSDNEHQYVQMLVAGPLFKQYGATPEVAAALYDVQSSNGQQKRIRLNKALLTTPACLTGVMEHIEAGTLGAWEPHHLEYHVPGYVEEIWGDNVKSNLKKFKQFADGAATPEDRSAFVDFYNFYKGYASLNDKEDYGDDLENEGEVKKEVVLPVYDTDPLFSVKDAEQAGWHWDEVYEDKRCFFFFPGFMDDPTILDYVLDQWEAGGKIARNVNMTFINWNEEEDDNEGITAIGKWVFNIENIARDFGVLLSDAKNKPFVLYGLLNAVQLASRWGKRPFKTAEEAEIARLSALVSDPPKREKLANERERELEKRVNGIFVAVLTGKCRWTVRQIALTFKPEDGRFYDAAMLLRVKVEIYLGELDTAAALYDELSARRPEFADYFAQKKKELGS